MNAMLPRKVKSHKRLKKIVLRFIFRQTFFSVRNHVAKTHKTQKKKSSAPFAKSFVMTRAKRSSVGGKAGESLLGWIGTL